MGHPWTRAGCITPGRFGSGSGKSVSGPAIVLGLRVLWKRLWVTRREVSFFGGVFRWRDGHKLHRKVAGKGNALIISKVNKGREERGISSLYSGKMREGENKKK